jgi:hypothetical protein
MVRVRPFNKKEIAEVGGIPVCTLACHSDTMISCIDPSNPEVENVFPFDGVFWSMPDDQVKAAIPFADQQDVYKLVGVPQLDSMFEGYNGCIFAYGQTSSGKTHSMMGYEGHGRGITPRLCEELFMRIKYKSETPDDLKRTSYVVKVSFLEIYNEKVQDLLAKKGADLKIVHDPLKGPVVKGLSEHAVRTWDDVNQLLTRGMETRTTAATAMNDTSSRSHAVVQISLDMEDSLGVVGGKSITRPRRSRANLVDLAGSEKVSKSKVEGANLKEAIGINQSLTCLGRVIDGLVENKPHIPYRDSVLTCLLADSLGGNSRTSMLAALSPAAINYDETLSTLRYASRARKIVNKVKINEDPAAALIRELQDEMARLKMGLAGGEGQRLADGTILTQAVVAERTAEVQEALAKLNELQTREEAAEQKREEKWRAERERINEKHAQEMENLRLEQEQLEQQKHELEARHQTLKQDLDQKRKMQMVDMFKHRTQISTEKVKKDATIEQAKRLKSELIKQRFQIAGQKARLQEMEDVGRNLEANKRRAQSLETELVAAKKRLDWLELHPTKEYDPADATDPRNPTHMAGMPVGEETVYDGPLCDMCQEQPAQYRCMQPPCSGDVYCVWCDANQHRRRDKRVHKRTPISSPCECCGAREAHFMCPGCDDMRLCKTCDDHKHGHHMRTNIIEVPCDFCGLREAEVACYDCPAKACAACDDVTHRAVRRQQHARRYQTFTIGDDMVEIVARMDREAEEQQRREEQEQRQIEEEQRQLNHEEYLAAQWLLSPATAPPEEGSEPEMLAEPELPFQQDTYHTYIPERPKFKRMTGPEARATPNFHAGTHLAYKDTAYESYRTRWEEHLAAHAPPPQPAAAGPDTSVRRSEGRLTPPGPQFPYSPKVAAGAQSPPITQPRTAAPGTAPRPGPSAATGLGGYPVLPVSVSLPTASLRGPPSFTMLPFASGPGAAMGAARSAAAGYRAESAYAYSATRVGYAA